MQYTCLEKVPPSSLKEMAKYWPSSERRLAIVRLLLHVSTHTPYMFLSGALYNKQYINYSQITKNCQPYVAIKLLVKSQSIYFLPSSSFPFSKHSNICYLGGGKMGVCVCVCVCVCRGGGVGFASSLSTLESGGGKLTR